MEIATLGLDLAKSIFHIKQRVSGSVDLGDVRPTTSESRGGAGAP
jgi:hypothetical protein